MAKDTATTEKAGMKGTVPWLVMVYLAGDNNLSEECVFDITEMRKAKLGRNIVVMAQLDSGIHSGTRIVIHDGTTISPGEFISGELDPELRKLQAAQQRGKEVLRQNPNNDLEAIGKPQASSENGKAKRSLQAQKILVFLCEISNWFLAIEFPTPNACRTRR